MITAMPKKIRTYAYRGYECPECGSPLKMGWRNRSLSPLILPKEEIPEQKKGFIQKITEGIKTVVLTIGWLVILTALCVLCYHLLFPNGITNTF